MNPVAGLLLCLLPGACSRSAAPGPDFGDYRLRENCLYRTLCGEIHGRGVSHIEEAAQYASAVCEQPISQKKMQHAASTGGGSSTSEEPVDERMALLEFDWHAMAVAQQLKDQCGASQ